MKITHTIGFIVVLLTGVSAATGLFSEAGAAPKLVTNAYGTVTELYGKGLYAYDAAFRVPVFQGTDAVMLFLACPFFIAILIWDINRQTNYTKLQVASMYFAFSWYAVSIAFGVAYNRLHLVYILLFAFCCMGLLISLLGLSHKEMHGWREAIPLRTSYVFLILITLGLLVAWLPGILDAVATNAPPEKIGLYTTAVTHVLDLGLLVPLCCSCMYYLHQRKAYAFVLLDLLATLCIIIGIMTLAQMVFQRESGIDLPTELILAKVTAFIALAILAAQIKWTLYKDRATPPVILPEADQLKIAFWRKHKEVL